MASKFTITAELNLQTKNLNQVVNNLRQQFQGADLNIKIKDLTKVESQLRSVSRSAVDASKDFNEAGNAFNQAFKRFTVITAVTGTLVGFTRSVKKAVGDAIEFEREVVKISQASGKTVTQLQGLVSEVGNVATSFGSSSKELLNAARTLTQAGFAADRVTGALKILAQTDLAATFDSIQDTTEGAIALLNQFGRAAQKTGQEAKFLEQSFSAINQVSKEFAVESSDLITAIRTTGSAFESAGGNLNELIALFTSVRSTTRESAESIATGFRTIFTRVQRVDTINALRNLGIELQDVEGKFVGPMEATKRLSAALSSIDPRDFRFNLIVEELGGFRQVSKVIPLIQQFTVAQKALGVAQGASGTLAKDAQTAQQSLAVQIAKTREEFSRFIRELVGSSSFQDTAQFLLGLANAFIKVADSIKPLVPLIAGFAAIKIGNALGVGLRSFGSKGAKGRDIPIGFAGGGFVPGSGNGDTVPAMLTPGEFVIRKSSVKKLGANNLARVNKYADGGFVVPVNQIADNKSAASATIERKGSSPKSKPVTVGLNKDSIGVNDFSIETVDFYVQNNKYKAKNGTKIIDIPDNFIEILKKNNKLSADLFEVIVHRLVGGALVAGNAPLDIVNGNKLIDAKFKPAGVDDKYHAAGKTLNYLLGQAQGGKGNKGGYSANANNTLVISPRQRVGNTVLTENSDEINSGKTFKYVHPRFSQELFAEEELRKIKKTYAISKAQKEKLEEMEADYDKGKLPTSEFQKLYYLRAIKSLYSDTEPNFYGKLAVNKINKWSSGYEEGVDYKSEIAKAKEWSSEYNKKKPKKFATGGLVPGSGSGDTVPAMLTPGEFVIRKSSVQKLGVDKLHKINKYALGGPAEKFKSARAITIPRQETYTYDKSAGADVDEKSPDGKMYKVNALDRLDYNRVNHLVDIDKENVPSDLKELYNKAKPDDRGGVFEKILLTLGKVQSLSAMQNARLDAISSIGNPSEIKSRIQQMNNKEFEEKLWGAIVSNADGSLAEMAMRQRMNANKWTSGDDVFNVGTVEVFEDVTRGLGKEINAQEIKTDLEIQQARQQKELSKAATANARAKLQAAAEAVIGNNNDNYLIKGEATKPLSRKNEIYANTIAAIRRTLNISNMDDFWPSIAQMTEQELEQAVRDSIQRRASGGFIEKFANGGFSSGTDTIPAMLTPGEFVINKKSAQKIGYSRLNRMNKVGKYATGGVVQGFNIGGGVSKEKLSSMTPEELKSIGYLNDPNITKFLSPSSHSLINILANSSSAIPNLGDLIKKNKVNFNDIKIDLSKLAGLTSFSNIAPPKELYSNVYGPAFSALISELGFDSSELKANDWTGSVFSGADNSKLIKILRSKIGKEFSYGATGIPATNSFSPVPNYKPDAIDSVSFQITPLLNQFGKTKGIGTFDKANGASLVLPLSKFLLDDVTKIKDSVVLHLTQKGTEISKTADTLTSQYGPKHENAANAHELLFMMQGKNALKNYSQIATELMNEYGKKVKQDYDNFLNPPQKPDLSAVPSIDISSVYAIPKNKKELIAKYIKGIQLGTAQELQDFGAVPISYGSDVDLSNKNLTRYTEEEIKAIAAYVSGPNATVGGKPVNSPFGSGGINSTLEYIAKGQSDKIRFDDAKKQKAAELAKLLDSAANKKSYIPAKIYSGIHQMRLDDVLNQLFSGDILKQAEWNSKKFNDSRKAFKVLSSASPIGKTFSISSFLSTSRDHEVAKAFSSNFNNSVLLEIATKRSKLNRSRNIFLDGIEREHILPRNSQFKINGMREHNGRIIFDVQQFAKGGSVFQPKGTDTVPAMLTPGEFVINKKSAEKIGYSSLNRMNKVGKYADGGPVQYFSDGTGPRGVKPKLDIYERSSLQRKAQDFLTDLMKKNNIKPDLYGIEQVSIKLGQINEAGGDAAKVFDKIVKGIEILGDSFKLIKTSHGTSELNFEGLKEAYNAGNDKYLAFRPKPPKSSDNPDNPNHFVNIDSLTTSAKVVKEESEKKATKEAEEKILQKNSQLEEALGKSIAGIDNFGDNTARLATNFAIVASAIQSVAVQFTGLSETVKQTVSSFGASFATFQSIGGSITGAFASRSQRVFEEKFSTLKADRESGKIKTDEEYQNKLSSLKKETEQSSKTLSVFNSALTGISVGLSAATAVTAYFEQVAKESSEKLGKSLNTLAEDVNKVSLNKLTQESVQSFTDASRSASVSSNLTGSRGSLAIGTFGGLGALAGVALAFGPLGVAATAAAAALTAVGGLWLIAEKQAANRQALITKSAQEFARGMYDATREIQGIQKFLLDIDKKTDKEVFERTSSGVKVLVSSTNNLINAQKAATKAFGGLSRIPKETQSNFDLLAQSTQRLIQEFDKLIGAAQQRSAKEIGRQVESGNYNVIGQVVNATEQQRENIRKRNEAELRQRFEPQINDLRLAGFNKEADKAEENLKNLIDASTQKGVYEFKLGLMESARQSLLMREALLKEKILREKLLGTLAKQIAIETALTNFEYALNRAAASVDSITAAYTGSISGLRTSGTIDSRVLDVTNPMGQNSADYDKAISTIGKVDEETANNLKASQKANLELKKLFSVGNEQINLQEFTGANQGDFTKKIIDLLKIDNDAVREGIQKSLESINPQQFKDMSAKERNEKFLEVFENVNKDLVERGKRILNLWSQLEQQNAKIYDQITASQNKQVEMQLAGASATETLLKNLDSVYGRQTSLAEKNARRFGRQQILAGGLAGNPNAIGSRLSDIRNQLASGNLDQAESQKLASEANKLEKALGELADQGQRTADTLEEIAKYREQREAYVSSATRYAFGSDEDRASMDQAAAATQMAVSQGTIEGLSGEQRQAVSSMLDELGPLGKDIKKELTARFYEGRGQGNIANLIRNASTPEQMLAQELTRIFNQEQEARNQLFNQEANLQVLLIGEITRNTTEVTKLSETIKQQTAATQQQINAMAAGAGVNRISLDDQLKEVQDAIATTDKFIQVFNGKIEALGKSLGILQETLANFNTENATKEKNQQKFQSKLYTSTMSIAGKQPQISEERFLQLPKEIQNEWKDISVNFPNQFTDPAKFAEWTRRVEELESRSLESLNKSFGGLIYRAGGGFAPRGTDTVPAMLTPGEFVMRKSAVDKYGTGMMSQINAKTFAQGGGVGATSGGFDFNPLTSLSISKNSYKELETQTGLSEKGNSALFEQNALLELVARLLKSQEKIINAFPPNVANKIFLKLSPELKNECACDGFKILTKEFSSFGKRFKDQMPSFDFKPFANFNRSMTSGFGADNKLKDIITSNITQALVLGGGYSRKKIEPKPFVSQGVSQEPDKSQGFVAEHNTSGSKGLESFTVPRTHRTGTSKAVQARINEYAKQNDLSEDQKWLAKFGDVLQAPRPPKYGYQRKYWESIQKSWKRRQSGKYQKDKDAQQKRDDFNAIADELGLGYGELPPIQPDMPNGEDAFQPDPFGAAAITGAAIDALAKSKPEEYKPPEPTPFIPQEQPEVKPPVQPPVPDPAYAKERQQKQDLKDLEKMLHERAVKVWRSGGVNDPPDFKLPTPRHPIMEAYTWMLRDEGTDRPSYFNTRDEYDREQLQELLKNKDTKLAPNQGGGLRSVPPTPPGGFKDFDAKKKLEEINELRKKIYKESGGSQGGIGNNSMLGDWVNQLNKLELEYKKNTGKDISLPKPSSVDKKTKNLPGMDRNPNVPRNDMEIGKGDNRFYWPGMEPTGKIIPKPPQQYPPGPGQTVQDSVNSQDIAQKRKVIEKRIEDKKKEIYEASKGMGSSEQAYQDAEVQKLLGQLQDLEAQKNEVVGQKDTKWANRKFIYGDPDLAKVEQAKQQREKLQKDIEAKKKEILEMTKDLGPSQNLLIQDILEGIQKEDQLPNILKALEDLKKLESQIPPNSINYGGAPRPKIDPSKIGDLQKDRNERAKKAAQEEQDRLNKMREAGKREQVGTREPFIGPQKPQDREIFPNIPPVTPSTQPPKPIAPPSQPPSSKPYKKVTIEEANQMIAEAKKKEQERIEKGKAAIAEAREKYNQRQAEREARKDSRANNIFNNPVFAKQFEEDQKKAKKNQEIIDQQKEAKRKADAALYQREKEAQKAAEANKANRYKQEHGQSFETTGPKLKGDLLDRVSSGDLAGAESLGLVGNYPVLSEEEKRKRAAEDVGKTTPYVDSNEKKLQDAKKIVEDTQKMIEEEEAKRKKQREKMLYRAGGGSIFKPRGTDTVPAMLTPGEFVVKKSAVDKIGVSALQHINNGGKVQYAFGGKLIDRNGFGGGPGSTSSFRTGWGGSGIGIGNISHLGSMSTRWSAPMGGYGAVNPYNFGMTGNFSNFGLGGSGGFGSSFLSGSNIVGGFTSAGLTQGNRFYNGPISSGMGMGFGGMPLVQYGGLFDPFGFTNYFSGMLTGGVNPFNHMAAFDAIFNQRPRMFAAANDMFQQGMYNRMMQNYVNPAASSIFGRGRGASQNPYSRYKLPYRNFLRGNNLFDRSGRPTLSMEDFLKKYIGRSEYFSNGGLTDTIPAMLTPGEFVMNKNAVDKHGLSFMNSLNNGKVKGFAKGGPVGTNYLANGGSPIGMQSPTVNIDINGIGAAIQTAIQSGFAGIGSLIDLDAVSKLVNSFATFTQSMNSLLSKVSGMTMTHNVRVDGNINIGGFNSTMIANAIKSEVVNLVINQVNQILNQRNNEAKN